MAHRESFEHVHCNLLNDMAKHPFLLGQLLLVCAHESSVIGDLHALQDRVLVAGQLTKTLHDVNVIKILGRWRDLLELLPEVGEGMIAHALFEGQDPRVVLYIVVAWDLHRVQLVASVLGDIS